jgi:hydrogenase 3 maturation protease
MNDLDLRERVYQKRVLILGVGNTLRGDDGAGPALIERLQGKVQATLIDAGEVPENFIGPIEAARPQSIVIVDAADIGASAGEVAILELDQIAEIGLTTHNASLALITRLLQSSTQADVFLLGIQPEAISFGILLSVRVDQTLQSLEQLFRDLLKPSSRDG